MFIPLWSQYLMEGACLFLLMAVSAVLLGRAGRSPYWAVLSVPLFLLAGGILHAEESAPLFCEESALYWQILCDDRAFFPPESCLTEDAACAAAAKAREELPPGEVYVPDDAPEGYQEQIFVVQ
jgi:hypothetical protein